MTEAVAKPKRRKTTLSGKPPVNIDAPAPDMETNESGTHKDYWVLSEEERSNGFVRPYRESYTHSSCGSVTRMGAAIAETFATDNTFYSHTFCCCCGGHFPVGEFTWESGEAIGI
jgi:hypothetical protein